MRALIVALAAALAIVVLLPTAEAQGGVVLVAEIEGEITRATVEYVKAAIEAAGSRDARALVFRLDTPGGGLAETLEIQGLFFGSRIPIVAWVAPAGVSAWSAGTILLVSADVAAMAPFTTIGSVQPVGLGGEPIGDPKIVNAIVGSLEEHLLLHDRNATLAQAFVVDNLNLNAQEALAAGAIEFVAGSEAELLAAIDGFPLPASLLSQAPHKPSTLDTQGASVQVFSAPFGVAFLAVIANPIISGLLLILGFYAIVFGLSAPGHGAEIAGIVMIALGVIGLGFSVNLVAIFLLLMGVALLLVEVFTPGFGVFGTAGIVCVVVGTMFLAPVSPPNFLISRDAQLAILAALLTPTAAFGAFLLFALYKVMLVRKKKPAFAGIVGEEAEAVDPIVPGGRGYVMYQGEMWTATAQESIAPGEKVLVTAKDGIVLTVTRKPAPAPGATPGPQAT